MNIPSLEEAKERFFDGIYRPSIPRANFQKPFDGLDRGTRILSTATECNQYIALYAGHHFHKLYAAFASTQFENIDDREVEIVDWGCGQALATCILIDYLIERGINLNVLSITLIEPSEIALQCGYNYIKQMFQNNASIDSVVRRVNKSIDDVLPVDLVSQSNVIKIHLFSNIIDVEGFDLARLHRLIVDSFQGINQIICTSPDNFRQQRLDTFYNLFSQSHQPTRVVSLKEAIFEEVFYAANNRFEQLRIGRCEKQFTVNLTQS
jgi:hypothetical protein